MFTDDGLKWLADWIAEEAEGGWLVVSDGAGNSEVASIEEIEVTSKTEPDDPPYSVTCTATFGEDAANFDWAKRSIKLKEGTVIETNEDDGGRKVQGAIWEAEVTIDVTG